MPRRHTYGTRRKSYVPRTRLIAKKAAQQARTMSRRPQPAGTNAGLLSVPGARSRGNSMDSATENGESNSSGTFVTSSQGDTLKGDLGPTEIPSPEEALKPEPGTVRKMLLRNPPQTYTNLIFRKPSFKWKTINSPFLQDSLENFITLNL